MFSVVEIKGHQYKVSAGDLIDVEKMDVEEGKTVELDKVLLIGGEKVQVGTPTVAGAKVTAQVVKQARTRKLIVLRRSPGGYRKKNGHRQHFTGLVITEINDGKGGVAKIDANHKNAKRLKK
jgi:large subunit ribosomal protein L21